VEQKSPLKKLQRSLQRSLEVIGRARARNDAYLLSLVSTAEKWFAVRQKEVERLRKALATEGDRKKRRVLEQFYLEAVVDRAVSARVAQVLAQHLQDKHRREE